MLVFIFCCTQCILLYSDLYCKPSERVYGLTEGVQYLYVQYLKKLKKTKYNTTWHQQQSIRRHPTSSQVTAGVAHTAYAAFLSLHFLSFWKFKKFTTPQNILRNCSEMKKSPIFFVCNHYKLLSYELSNIDTNGHANLIRTLH